MLMLEKKEDCFVLCDAVFVIYVAYRRHNKCRIVSVYIQQFVCVCVCVSVCCLRIFRVALRCRRDISTCKKLRRGVVGRSRKLAVIFAAPAGEAWTTLGSSSI